MSSLKQLVLASSNQGKLKEITQILAPLNITVLPQSEFNVSDADETGLSFVENAIIKARHACQATGLPALSDDSGIEVDFLHGQPGIYSARYSGEGATDKKNIDKLLQALNDVPDDQRTARFQCIMVLMRHEKDPTPIIAQGAWEGKIKTALSGAGGFGYDPVFYVPSHNCSAADLSKEEKNSISHRAKALRALMTQLQ